MPNENLFAKILNDLGERQGKNLFNDLKNEESLSPRLTLSKGLAFAFATIIHGLTVFIALAGILLIIRGFSSIFLVIAGIVLLGVAWVLRPRQDRMIGTILTESTAPELDQLTKKICHILEAPSPTGYQLNSDFNAGYKRQGFPSKHFVLIGLPLWSILSDQEKVALLAHEMAHSVNGDSTRGFFIGSAIHSLSEYHYLLCPDQIWDAKAGLRGLITIPFNLIFFLVAKLAYGCAYLMSLLLYQDMQRAEYLADVLAAEVAGKSATISLLQKLSLHLKVDGLVRKYSLNDLDPLNLFSELKTLKSMSAEEVVLYAADHEPVRLDASHPPTKFRIELLEHHEFSDPKLQITPDIIQQISKEFESHEGKMARKMIGMYEQSLYHR